MSTDIESDHARPGGRSFNDRLRSWSIGYYLRLGELGKRALSHVCDRPCMFHFPSRLVNFSFLVRGNDILGAFHDLGGRADRLEGT